MRATACARSERWLLKFWRSAFFSGSSVASPSGAREMRDLTRRNSSASARRWPCEVSSKSVHRPGSWIFIRSSNSSAKSERLPALPSDFARLAAILMARVVISAVDTEVMRPSSSWASSIMATSCSGKIFASETASMASMAWLVTTMSTSAAALRASSAKQSGPCGQRDAPKHSLEVTDTARHTKSGTPGSRSSRSPVSVSCAHSWIRRTALPRWDISDSSIRASGSSGVAAILFMHR